MKTLSLLVLLLFFLFHHSFSQNATSDTMKLLILSERVGEKIDLAERDHYKILQLFKNFVSATFYQLHDSLYVALVETQQADGVVQTMTVEYPLSVLFRMAEKINHFEEITAHKYFSGEDVTTIIVVGGQQLQWAPKLPSSQIQVVANQANKKDEQVGKDEHRSAEREEQEEQEEFQRYELKLSYGRGFAKGAPPFHSEDVVVRYDSPSYKEVSNVKDEYVSLGQGQRFEMKLIYYMTKQIGFFLKQ